MTASHSVVVRSALIAVLAVPEALAQIPPVEPLPYTALSAGPTAPFPSIQPGGTPPGNFEYTAIALGTHQYGPSFTPPGWVPWTMGNGTGIASNGSGFLSTGTVPPNPPAPEGIRVAFVQGQGTMSTQFAFGVGTWRLKFKAAQRSFLGVNRQVVRITIAGTEVLEFEPEGVAYQDYTTRAIQITSAAPQLVSFAGLNPHPGDNTAFFDEIQVEPIAPWSQGSTWNQGSPPGPADVVEIPANVEVALDGAANAKTVHLHGELLTTTLNASLAAKWVAVHGTSAYFEVGREGTPYTGTFTLTLKGTSSDPPHAHGGTKFLMAMDGGRIDMHGVAKKSWTKLQIIDGTGYGIRVDDKTGWQPGDWVVVAFTGHISHTGLIGTSPTVTWTQPRSQRRQIDTIDAITGMITLKAATGPALVHAEHCTALPSTYVSGAQSWTLDERAEVGMLTRNIVITGDGLPAGTTFGGHVMLMKSGPTEDPGIGRFANVELTQMGQSQVLGRYPMHWHMQLEDGAGQYLRNCSVHTSHNRAVVVHGSHGVEVADNVCFDIFGHAMFLEDGVEKDNVFARNLVLGIKKGVGCDRMLMHDNSRDAGPVFEPQNRSPAAFWISHPENTFVDNVAADSLGVGYWFALHREPTGASSTATWVDEFEDPAGVPWNATLAPLGTFAGNVAHSMKMGMDVHDSIERNVANACLSSLPPEDPRDDDLRTNIMWQPPVNAVISGFTAYGCTTGIYTGGGMESIGTIVFDDCVLADNGVHAHFASMDTVQHSLMLRDSGNLIFPTGPAPAGNGLPNGHLGGFQQGYAYVLYDGPGRMRDCHLVGYSGPTGWSAYFSMFGAARRHTDHRVSGLTFPGGASAVITFPDVTTFVSTDPQAQSNVWGFTLLDEDFSLTAGSPPNPANPFLISNHPMVHLSNGAATPDAAAGTFAWWSPFKWSHLQVRYFEGLGGLIPNTNLYWTYGLLAGDHLPTAAFTRHSYTPVGGGATWPPASHTSSFLPGPQMRQLPVIVRSLGGVGSGYRECAYELVLHDATPQQTTNPVRRADVSIDDYYVGDIARLQIRHNTATAWTPTLYVNDDPAFIDHNGQHPFFLTALAPNGPTNVTSYTMTTIGGSTVIDLRLVKPSNSNRAHRITIVW